MDVEAQGIGSPGAESVRDIDAGRISLFWLEYRVALISFTESSFLGLGYENMLEMFVMDKCSQEYAQDLSFVWSSALEHSDARVELIHWLC